MLNHEARKAGKYRDRIYGMNSSLFVNRGLPAFARATARQALIKMDQKDIVLVTAGAHIRVISDE